MRALIVLEGTNDLTSGITGEPIYAGLRAIADRAQQAGLSVVMATFMPRQDVAFGWDRLSMESERELVNERIRTDTNLEGIADFDAAMGSPVDPTLPNPLYYSPDLLHPTTLGFAVMANAVPMEALVPPPVGTCAR